MDRPLNLAERAAVTQATIARFDRPFDWDDRTTCIHLFRRQARAMGHRVPALGDVRSPLAARAALKRLGFARVEDALDASFPRIPPAMMLVGDLAALPGEDDDGALSAFPSLTLFDGAAMLIGWHGSDPSRLRPIARATQAITAAWRL